MPKSFKVKKATFDDWKTISAIEKFAISKLYSTGIKDEQISEYLKRETVLLAFVEDKIIGKISYRKQENVLHISGLVILSDWRKMGYGTKFSEYVIDLFPNVKTFELTVHPENKQAVSIYQKLGFVTTERIENLYGDGEPRLVMTLTRAKN